MVKNFNDVLPQHDLKSLENINVLENKTFSIKSVEYGISQFGEYAIIKTLNSKNVEVTYRTSAKVLLDQLKQIQPHLESDMIKVTLKKVNNKYWSFS